LTFRALAQKTIAPQQIGREQSPDPARCGSMGFDAGFPEAGFLLT